MRRKRPAAEPSISQTRIGKVRNGIGHRLSGGSASTETAPAKARGRPRPPGREHDRMGEARDGGHGRRVLAVSPVGAPAIVVRQSGVPGLQRWRRRAGAARVRNAALARLTRHFAPPLVAV